MATPHSTADVAEINLDVPCASCGYNLRGLSSDGKCPECGASVARSLEIHLNPIAPTQVLWARMVLAGLVIWLVLSPICLCIVLDMGSKFPWFALMWMNYPGPKLWAVPMARAYATGIDGPLGYLGMVLPLLLLFAAFLMTAPRTRGARESLFSLRRWTRWTAVALAGGFFAVCVGSGGIDNNEEAIALVFLAVLTVELPGTVLIYQYVADIARRVELTETAIELRLCGWIAGAIIIASGALLMFRLAPQDIGGLPLVMLGFWLAGAIAVGAAIVACANLLRLVMALWPIAMVRLVRRSQ
jgi:hypothetical protein